MNLSDLCTTYPVLSVRGDTSLEISNIVYDSRRVRPGSLFVAIRGSRQDGHDFVEQVISQGAVALIVSDPAILNRRYEGKDFEPGIILVDDSRDALAYAAAQFFAEPSKRLKLIVCTGLHGRHTLSGMIYALWRNEGIAIAYLNGMHTYTPDGPIYGSRNHPESLENQINLAELADHGIKAAVLPLSRQDIFLKRVAHMKLQAAVVMNALDWESHAWLQLCQNSQHLIVNIDDPAVQYYFDQPNPAKKMRPYITFAIDRKADFRARNLHIIHKNGRLGTEFTLDIHGQPSYQVFIGLPGRYHVLNSLAALALTSLSALSLSAAIKALETILIPGRTEPVVNDQGLEIVIDTAWTAVSMENLLTGLRPYCKGRLILVCGSGGDRASQARIDLAKTAGRLADYSYLTVTNERSEGAASIVSDLEEGIRQTSDAYALYHDRSEAILAAVMNMEDGDLLIISGNSAESYSMSAEETVAYSDHAAVLAALDKRKLKIDAAGPVGFKGEADL